MKIYLASRYSRREELCQYRLELEELGHTVTSRWLNGNHQIDKNGVPIGDSWESLVESAEVAPLEEIQNKLRENFLAEDCEDVRSSECIINFTEPPRSAMVNRGGRHVEFGIAIGLGKRLVVVGYRENLFHYLPQVSFFADWPKAVIAIGGIAA